MSRHHDILAELQGTTREAAGVLKDLQRSIKEARQIMDQIIPSRIEEHVLAHCTRAADVVNASLADIVGDAEKAIHQRFDRIAKILLDQFGPESTANAEVLTMEEVVQAAAATSKIMRALHGDGPEAQRLSRLVDELKSSS